MNCKSQNQTSNSGTSPCRSAIFLSNRSHGPILGFGSPAHPGFPPATNTSPSFKCGTPANPTTDQQTSNTPKSPPKNGKKEERSETNWVNSKCRAGGDGSVATEEDSLSNGLPSECLPSAIKVIFSNDTAAMLDHPHVAIDVALNPILKP